MAPSDPPSLRDQRCLVTGGSRNLGRALCLALARAGARVAFTYPRNHDDADDTERAIAAVSASPARRFCGSVADAAHAREVVDALVADWGGIDILVNNASAFQPLPFALVEERDWDAVMDVCAKGPYLFARAALRPMLRQKRGHILNIGAFSEGRTATRLPAHFAAAKAALHGFTRALAQDVGARGIRVNYLAPGIVDAGLGRRLPQSRVQEYLEHCAAGRLATSDDIVAIALWMVSADSALMTGANILADGGLRA